MPGGERPHTPLEWPCRSGSTRVFSGARHESPRLTQGARPGHGGSPADGGCRPHAPWPLSGSPRAPSEAPACAAGWSPWRCAWTGRTPRCRGSIPEPGEGGRESTAHGRAPLKEPKPLSTSSGGEVPSQELSLKERPVSEMSILVLNEKKNSDILQSCHCVT